MEFMITFDPEKMFPLMRLYRRTTLAELLGPSITSLSSRLTATNSERTPRRNARKSHVFMSRKGLYATVPRTLTLCAPDAARNICKMVRRVVKDVCHPLLELHPGPGLLSEELIKAGQKNLYLYEPRLDHKTSIKMLMESFDLKSNIFYKPFCSMFFSHGKVQLPEHFDVKECFPFLSPRKWKDSPAFSIIGSHGDFRFWLWMLLNIGRITNYHNLGRPRCILAVPQSEWLCILDPDAARNRRGRHAAGSLYPDYFEWEILGDIPRDAFLPLRRPNSSQKSSGSYHYFKNIMVVLSFAPSRKLFDVLDCSGLQELQYFIEQHMNGASKKQYVIRTLEKWIPGCGRTLVLNGFNITQQFYDLDNQEIMKLFLCFKSLPEYSTSAFVSSMKDQEINVLEKGRTSMVKMGTRRD